MRLALAQMQSTIGNVNANIARHLAFIDRAAAGATLYLASVAKSAAGVKAAGKRLAEIARTFQIPALMVNAVGPAEGFDNAGGTAVWDHHGRCLTHITPDDEALLLYTPASTTTPAEAQRLVVSHRAPKHNL